MFLLVILVFFNPPTLPETNVFAPENGWLEFGILLSYWVGGLFSGAKMLVSGRVTQKPG